jgi:predicted enzyme related to lactoylglutathione lyase
MSKPKVIGIGGVFFKAKQPDILRAWYRDALGFHLNHYGSSFEFRNANDPEQVNYFLWSALSSQTEYFWPSKKNFMINYRVDDLEAILEELQESGVTVIDEISTYPYGKFVHILDPEGNAIELWEANDDFFTEIIGPTNK